MLGVTALPELEGVWLLSLRCDTEVMGRSDQDSVDPAASSPAWTLYDICERLVRAIPSLGSAKVARLLRLGKGRLFLALFFRSSLLHPSPAPLEVHCEQGSRRSHLILRSRH